MKSLNKSGIILPSVLFILLMLSSLLLTMSDKLMTSALSNSYREEYLHAHYLEKLVIKEILYIVTDEDFYVLTPYSETLLLSDSTRVTLNFYHTLLNKHQVNYSFYLSNGIISGSVVYDKTKQTYLLK